MKKLTLPLAISAALLLVYGGLKWFRPDLAAWDQSKYLIAAMLVAFSVFVVRAASFVLFDVAFRKRKGREAPALLRGLLSVTLYPILFLVIYRGVLERGGLEILATSTVISVIIGLALQDTLGNFFAGLSLHVEQPFHILDALQIGQVLGRVESITWRATTLRTNNNSVIVFPNSKIARESIEIYPFNNLNRRILRVPAPYSIPPERVIRMMREAVSRIPDIAPERTPVVRIGDFADSSVTYEVLYWIKDYMRIHDVDAIIREHTWYLYRRNDIEIPFPTRHVLLEQRQASGLAEQAGYDRAIESVEIFEPLTAEERETVAQSLVRYVYAPGEVILRRGDPGDSMFVISRGRVEVRLPATNGHLQKVAVLEPGNFFGEMALLTGEMRNADVYALDEVEILEIRKGVLQQLLSNNAELAGALSKKITERAARLAEYSHTVPEEEKRMQTETLLRRIRRFFSLGQS